MAGKDQKDELASVKENNLGRCRIISDVGKYTNTVTIQPVGMDATIKFQLTAAYPTCIPEIVVRSDALDDTDKLSLQQHLSELASKNLNSPMLQMLVDDSSDWIKTNCSISAKSRKIVDEKSRRHKKKNRSKKIEDDVIVEKLASMKTADDVIKRIMWDGNLQSDNFLVGYWDRFLGIMEKKFSAFSWEEIAAVDYTVLAIPKHRIQYFKYKSEIVWDKGSRLDNVFGSTGSNVTISDVIERYEKRREADGDEDSDSDSDDDITVTIGEGTYTPKLPNTYTASVITAGDSAAVACEDAGDTAEVLPQDAEHTAADAMDTGSPISDEKEIDDPNLYENPWKGRLRPNFFIAVKITDPEIMENMEIVQDYIVEHEPQFTSCCTPYAAMHVTLCTLGLDTHEQVNKAVEALEQMKSELANLLPKEPLMFNRVGHFHHRVVIVKVQYPDCFLTFVEHLKMSLITAGLDIRDGHDFVPHLTVMKMNKSIARKMGKGKVRPALYNSFSDMSFGSQRIDDIYLCSMGSERQDDGFYVSPCHIVFNEKE